MSNAAVKDDQHERIDSIVSKELVIGGYTVTSGDTLAFKTDKGTVRVVVSGSTSGLFHKVVGDKDRYYTILPALSVWIGDVQTDAVGVIYHEELKKLILLDSSKDVRFRSRGHSQERNVEQVVIENAVKPGEEPEPEPQPTA